MEYLSRLFPPTCSQQKLGWCLPSRLVCTNQRARGLWAEVGARQSHATLQGAADLSLACQTRSAYVDRTAASERCSHSTKEPIILLISWATPEGGQTDVNPEHRGRIFNSIHTVVSLPGWGWGWSCLTTFQNHLVRHEIKLWSTLERRAASYHGWEHVSGPQRDRLCRLPRWQEE